MNAALMKALKARRASHTMPASGSPGTSSDAVGVVAGKPDKSHHHRELTRHLREGVKGSRATAKVKLKLALHHAECAGLCDDEPGTTDTVS